GRDVLARQHGRWKTPGGVFGVTFPCNFSSTHVTASVLLLGCISLGFPMLLCGDCWPECSDSSPTSAHGRALSCRCYCRCHLDQLVHPSYHRRFVHHVGGDCI